MTELNQQELQQVSGGMTFVPTPPLIDPQTERLIEQLKQMMRKAQQ